MKQINHLIIQAAKKKMIYTQHAIDEMNSEDEMITVDEVRSVIYHGEIIEDYRSQGDHIVSQYKEVCDCANKILNNRQLECFNMYYVDQLKLEEIGKKLNITKQAVSLHVKKGIIEVQRWMLKQD